LDSAAVSTTAAAFAEAVSAVGAAVTVVAATAGITDVTFTGRVRCAWSTRPLSLRKIAS
jgi:hypothetical protein